MLGDNTVGLWPAMVLAKSPQGTACLQEATGQASREVCHCNGALKDREASDEWSHMRGTSRQKGWCPGRC